MKDITIGITISIKEDNIWNNGITQNVVNLALVLKNSQNNYNVLILNTSSVVKLQYDIEGINVHQVDEKIQEIDVLFILGSEIHDNDYEYLKNKGCKIIHYCCGSNYILDTQDILFRENTIKKLYKHTPNELWIIPQNMNTNKYYFEILYRRPVKEAPFIWSPTFIDYILKNNKIKGTYTHTDGPKRISCFEPNIDVVKFAIYDILIVEQVYRKTPGLIKSFYVTNSDKIKLNPLFIDIMKQLDVVKDGIATFESRFRMPYFLDTYTDVVISHQWENPLNYAYLDALYLNYPLVHNAHMIKDVGYYYEGFNVKQGAEQLTYALNSHHKNMDKYNQRSKMILDRYLPTNQQSIEKYDMMIEDLYKK